MIAARRKMRIILVAWLILRIGAVTFRDTPPSVQLVDKLSRYSRMVYRVTSTRDGDIEDGTPHFFSETDAGTECLIMTSRDPTGNPRDMVAVIFRGTDEASDWWTNLDSFLDKFGPDDQHAPDDSGSVQVHGGFNKATFSFNLYARIESTIHDLLEDPSLDLDGTVHVTGHSLGGAIAHLTATYMAFRNPGINVKMINFGAPQIGNKSFKYWAESLPNLSAWRFCYKNDMVPRVAFHIEHVGHLVQLDDSRAQAYYRQTGGGKYLGVPSSWAAALSFSDHKALNYLEYFQLKSMKNPSRYYINSFVKAAASSTQKCTWWKPWTCF